MNKLLKSLSIISIFIITILTSSYFLYKKELKQIDTKVNEQVQILFNNSSSTNEKDEVFGKGLDNKDIKGTITIDSLEVDTLVVQSNNNSYYMNHDVNNNYNEVGSTFMDYRNTINSKKILIYGHNSKYLETLFGRLERYLDLEFTKNNPYITTNLFGSISIWEIFSIMIVPNTTKEHTRIEFTSSKELEEHISWMKDNSIISLDVEVNVNSQLLTIQTCYYNPDDSFLLINFKKVEEDNE